MIIYASVENTETLIGCADPETGGIFMKSTLSTDARRTVDEYIILIGTLLKIHGIGEKAIAGGIISSCVPMVTEALKSAMRHFASSRILEVGPGLKTGVHIAIDHPGELGADLLVAAAAGIEKYGAPLVIVSLNTLTTFSCVDSDRKFRGAIFVPGVRLFAKSLSVSTAMLPETEIRPIAKLIGTNTAESIRSGIFRGQAAAIDGILKDIAIDQGMESIKAVLTGSFAETIASFLHTQLVIDEDLAAEGLRLIYNKNTRS